MRLIAIVLIVLLAACSSQKIETKQAEQCKWPEIPSDGRCCRDLNENSICDTTEFAEEIRQQEQQEYEQAAQQARETAEKSGKMKRTIMNDLYDAAVQLKGYRFLYKGEEAVVENNTAVLKLISDNPVGNQEINGRQVKAFVNTITLNFAGKTATGRCIPPEYLVRIGSSTPCDEYAEKEFEVPFDKFAFPLPIKWLEDFLHRTPYESMTGQDVGKLKTTLHRFTDLQNANRRTSLWIDEQTKLPARVEVWQDNSLIQQEYYTDLRAI